jgi:hypothetical protein
LSRKVFDDLYDDNIRFPLAYPPNFQPVDLTGRRELKPEVRLKITPSVRVECVGQIQPIVLDVIDRSEPLVTKRIADKLLEATRAPIVIEFSVRLLGWLVYGSWNRLASSRLFGISWHCIQD